MTRSNGQEDSMPIGVPAYLRALDSNGRLVRTTPSDIPVVATGGETAISIDDRFTKIMTVYDFGLIHNGIADDWPAFQAYADYCGFNGTDFVVPDCNSVPYRLSQPIVFEALRTLEPLPTPPPYIQFADNLPFNIVGRGEAAFVATAAMDQMFLLIFNVDKAQIGPFHTNVVNIKLDGASLATSAIYSNYASNVTYTKLVIFNVQIGVKYQGYGGFTCRHSVIAAKYGFYLVNGGGDSLIDAIGWNPTENDSTMVFGGYYSGNMVVQNCTATNEPPGFDDVYLLTLDGTTTPDVGEIRNWVVTNNEACGLTSLVKATGKNSGYRNVWNNIITGNHVTPFGSINPGGLAVLVSCTDFFISGNFVNNINLGSTTLPAVTMTDCARISVRDNFFTNIGPGVVQVLSSSDCDITQNRFVNCGTLGASYAIINQYSAVGEVRIEDNIFTQASSSYAQNAIFEQDGANYTVALRNVFTNIGQPQRKAASGVNSVMVRTEYLSAVPGAGVLHNQADTIVNTAPTAGGNYGWVCVAAGNPGTFKAYGTIAA